MDNEVVCPICGNRCTEMGDQWKTMRVVQPTGTSFCCYNPITGDPLHYYCCHLEKESDELIYQEFSLDLGKRSVIFGNHYRDGVSMVKLERDGSPLEFPVVIPPDFPHLTSLKRKVLTAITFS